MAKTTRMNLSNVEAPNRSDVSNVGLSTSQPTFSKKRFPSDAGTGSYRKKKGDSEQLPLELMFDMTKAEAQVAYELRVQRRQRKSTWSRSNGRRSSAEDDRSNNHYLTVQHPFHRPEDRSDTQPSGVLQRPLILLPPTGRGSVSSESLPLSSGYSGYVQPLAGLHLPTRDGCPTSTSVHPFELSSTQFGSVQPQVSALASDTAGAGAAAQWFSVANDAAASSQTA